MIFKNKQIVKPERVLLFLFFLILSSSLSLAQSEFTEYCFENGTSCIGDTVFNPLDSFGSTKFEDATQGTIFLPLINDWNRDGEDEIIFFDGTTLSTFNLTMVIKGQTNSFPTNIRQPLLRNMDDPSSTALTNDSKQLVYIGDNNTADNHHDIIMINKTGTTFTLHKIIALEDKNETSGIVCKDVNADGVVECVFQKRSGHVMMYPNNATDHTGAINLGDICNGDGDVPDQVTGGVQDGRGLLEKLPIQDFDNDGDQDIFTACNVNVVAVDTTGDVSYNVSGFGSGQIEFVALANLRGTGTLEVIATEESFFGTCGGVSISSNLKVTDSTGATLYTENFACGGSGHTHKISLPIVVEDFTDQSDGLDELLIVSSNSFISPGAKLNVYDDWQFGSPSKTVNDIRFGTNTGDLFSLLPMTTELALTNPSFPGGRGYWLVSVASIQDPYRNIAVYNFSGDFSPVSFGQPFDAPVISVVNNNQSGLVHSQSGQTVSFLGATEQFEISINETSESENWHHVGYEQDENNIYGTSDFTGATGKWDTVENVGVVERKISRGGDGVQTLIADLDNDGVKEIIIGEDNFIYIYQYDATTDLMLEKNSFNLGSNLNQFLNIHKFPTRGQYLIIAFHDTEVTYLSWDGLTLSQVCNDASIGKTNPATVQEHGTTCNNGYCIGLSNTSVVVVDSLCTDKSLDVPGGAIINFQTPPFIDRASDTNKDLYLFTENGLFSDIYHVEIDEATGNIVSSGVMESSVFDDHHPSSLIAVDVDGGSADLFAFGSRVTVFSDHNYAIKSWTAGTNALGANLRFGDELGDSDFDIDECRGDSTVISPFSPTVTTVDGVTAVCGACITETNPVTPDTEGFVQWGCWNANTGNLLKRSSCASTNVCDGLNYGGVSTDTNKPHIGLIGGDFRSSSSAKELLMGRYLVDDDFNIIREVSFSSNTFPSVAKNVVDKDIEDIDIVYASLDGSTLTRVVSTLEANEPPIVSFVEHCPQNNVCLSVANVTGIQYDFDAIDPDNDPLTYNITATDGFSKSDTTVTSNNINFISFTSAGQKTVTLTVKDTAGNVVVENTLIGVVDQQPPICNNDLNTCASFGIEDATIDDLDDSVIGVVPGLNIFEKFGTAFAPFGIGLQVVGLIMTLIAFIAVTFMLMEAKVNAGISVVGGIFGGGITFAIFAFVGMIHPAFVIFMFALMVVVSLFLAVKYFMPSMGGG